MENKEKNFMSAVIYVHNAEERIGSFLDHIIRILESHFEKSEIICVDDFSSDGSAAAIKEASRKAGQCSVSILHMSYFHGLEAAMGAGVDLAIGDFVFEFDTTVQGFSEALVMQVYRKAMEGFDIVSASSDCRQRLPQKIFYQFLNKTAQFHSEIQTEDFRVISRRAINRIAAMHKSVPYRKAAYASCGLPMHNLKYRVQKDAKKAGRDRTEQEYRRGLAVDTLILFTQAGYKIALRMTFLMMFVAVFMAAYSIAVYAASTPVAGWMTTILFLSFAFFGLFGILTVMIKYLQIIVNLVFQEKRYSYRLIEKLTK